MIHHLLGKLISTLLVLLGIAYLSMIILGADNAIEEAIEEIIKEKLGKKIDLSPYQPGECK